MIPECARRFVISKTGEPTGTELWGNRRDCFKLEFGVNLAYLVSIVSMRSISR